jgi:two-component system response regulator EvgA
MKQALVVDDHPIVCEALKGLLETHFPLLKITPSSGGDGLLQEVCGAPWAFVVLDIKLCERRGLKLLKQTRACCKHLPIIVYSAHDERQLARRALLAGAVAFYSKHSSPWELVEIVGKILGGAKISRPIVQQPVLSKREHQVLTLLTKGVRRADIAQMLEISDNTVSAHQANLISKLGLRSSVELLRYAIDEGFDEESI